MLVYYGFLYHDYELPIKQYVLYIGRKEAAKMPTSTKHENLDFKFHLINIVDLDHEKFLYSKQPEDIVISILCDFKDRTADNIIETILKRLRLFSQDELELGKYLKQLEILSNLRNLQELTIKKLNDMSLIYDLETDIRYKQGYEKAQKEAELKLKEAELKTREAELRAREAEFKFQEEIVREMLDLNSLTKESIANISKTSVKFVEKIQLKILQEKQENDD